LQYEEEKELLSTLDGVVITGDLLQLLDVQTRWSSIYYFLKVLKSFTIITTYIEAIKFTLVVPMHNKLLDLLEMVTANKTKHPLI
jgi:hypothetical protein